MRPEQVVKFVSELQNSNLFSSKLITNTSIEKFKIYYQSVLKWNEFIPLTTITEPVDFARKHILEAIFAETFISNNINEIWDIGTGLGVPGIPMAIIRPESQIFLIEANKKKAIFLKELAYILSLSNIKVLNTRFESLPAFLAESCITSRALDDLNHLLPKILYSTTNSKLTLLLGSSELASKIQASLKLTNRIVTHYKVPQTTDRLIISITGCTWNN